MCGIVGICQLDGKPASDDDLERMSGAIQHRGPDDAGSFFSETKHVAFAHRRLSIIDLSENGRQPMCNEDGRLWITYNGELYNYLSLRTQLIASGHRFRSQTDTEVILHAYEEFGPQCLDQFIGMFSFAIYDQRHERVFAARDRFGIKPFYYLYKEPAVFAFSSEIKGLVHLPSFKRSLDHVSIGEYFHYRYIPAPRTIWSDIRALEPGHYLTMDLKNKKLRITRYYSLQERLPGRPPANLDEIYQLLGLSVTDRLSASDVEVGIFLSGGMDSTAISSLAAARQPGIKTFCIDFQPEEFSELKYALQTSRTLQTQNFSETITDLDHDDILRMNQVFDQPLADNSCIPTYRLSRLARRYVKVALSGEGGDEVFCGYHWYDQWLAKSQTLAARLNFFYRRLGLINPFHDFEQSYSSFLKNGFSSGEIVKFLAPSIHKDYLKGRSRILTKFSQNRFQHARNLQYVDLHTFLPNDMLVKTDLASMANSLEVRVPFLDHRLVEAVFSLKTNDFPHNATGKPLMRRFLSKQFDPEFINRPKRGFGAPMAHWSYLKNKGNQILNGKAVRLGILDPVAVQKILAHPHDAQDQKRWVLFVFENWLRHWGDL